MNEVTLDLREEGIKAILNGQLLENFPPDILFFAQARALELKNMKLVKKIAEFARNRKLEHI